MAGMFEYLKWRGDIPFSAVGVNPVDALVFSTLSYIDFEGIVSDVPDEGITLFEAAERFFQYDDYKHKVRVKSDVNLLSTAASTERFKNVRVTFYRSVIDIENEGQFAAMTFILDDGTAMLTYRGTDFTLVGWKEDFNLTIWDEIPAQTEGLRYLNEYAAYTDMPLRLIGHSKGGNVAVYAASKADAAIQDRIIEVYNQDGPGVNDTFMGYDGYLRMVPKIRTFLPQSSIVGMLFEHEESYTVVKSKNIGPAQHDPYSWEVMGPDFVRLEEVTDSSILLDNAITKWLDGMDKEQKIRLNNAIFDTLEAGGASRTVDLLNVKNLSAVIKEFSLDPSRRKIITDEFGELFEIIKNSLLDR